MEGESYYISSKLKYAVLNWLTAMVLDVYKDHEDAQLYYTKATEYMK